MILKGSQRAGAGALASHLMNDRDNDHVTVLEIRGFFAVDFNVINSCKIIYCVNDVQPNTAPSDGLHNPA